MAEALRRRCRPDEEQKEISYTQSAVKGDTRKLSQHEIGSFMSKFKPIPVVDLFAGPGGLGEGFSSLGRSNPKFRICLSIEKEKTAHQTLQLRAFYRQFPFGSAPKAYYSFLKNKITRENLFNQFPSQAEHACREAQCAELGVTDQSLIDNCIAQSLNKKKTWLLIGGPPCQAYSLAGRSRNKGIENYKAETDQRHFLYLEYLRIIAEHCPPLFIMENVKGLLSSRVNGTNIFARIINDLQAPYKIKPQSDTRKCFNYNTYSLVTSGTMGLFNDSTYNPGHFIVKSESYGIPQARHRVILLGIRQDYNALEPNSLAPESPVPAFAVLKDLPRIRSGLSRNDTPHAWCSSIKQILKSSWLRTIDEDIRIELLKTIENLTLPRKDRGDEFIQIFAIVD